MPPDLGPLDSMKFTQMHLKSEKIDEIHRKSSQGHQIPQESMKSTQIHFIEAASLPPGLQARCVQSSSHPVIESWRFQDCKCLTSNHRVIHSSWGFQDCKVSIGPRLPCNPVPQAATGCHRLPDPGPLDSMKSTQNHLKS